MSTPTRRVRQPGRTAQKYDPGNCGVCDPLKGNPSSTIGLIISGTGSCCSPSLDADSAHAYPLAPNGDPCVKGTLCAWEYTFVAGGVYVQISLSIECDSGVPTVNLAINKVDSSGAYIETLADGTFSSSAYGGCDSCDCQQLIDNASGGLTVYSNDICNPTFCTSPAWSIGTAPVNPCPQPAAKNCCCGGTPAIECTDCCGDGGKTEWDVDLSGFGTSDGSCCDALSGVFTLANSRANPCIWFYYPPINCPNGADTPIFLSCSGPAPTTWTLIVGGTFTGPEAGIGIKYTGICAAGCAAVTLSFSEILGAALNCAPYSSPPPTVNISPA